MPAIILIVTIWPNIFSAAVNFWIVIVAAVLILLGAIGCKSSSCVVKPVVRAKARPAKRKVAKKKRR